METGNKRSETFSLTLRTWSSTSRAQEISKEVETENQQVQKRLSAPHPGLLRSRTRLQGEQPLLCPPRTPGGTQAPIPVPFLWGCSSL